MQRIHCDICGQQITKWPHIKETDVNGNVREQIPKCEDMDVCLYCLTDALNRQDDRPKAAN